MFAFRIKTNPVNLCAFRWNNPYEKLVCGPGGGSS